MSIPWYGCMLSNQTEFGWNDIKWNSKGLMLFWFMQQLHRTSHISKAVKKNFKKEKKKEPNWKNQKKNVRSWSVKRISIKSWRNMWYALCEGQTNSTTYRHKHPNCGPRSYQTFISRPKVPQICIYVSMSIWNQIFGMFGLDRIISWSLCFKKGGC